MQALKSLGLIALLYLVTIGVMVGAAYLWVWLYSVAIHTHGTQAFYEAYAQTASPVVAVATAFPVFYAMGVCLRRISNAIKIATAVVVVHWLVEVFVLMSVANAVWLAPYAIASALLKAAGAWAALRDRGSPADS